MPTRTRPTRRWTTPSASWRSSWARPSARCAPVAPQQQSTDARQALTAGAALLQSLQRGALDDDALERLTASLGGDAAQAGLAPLHRALSDFDFPMAQTRLQALLRQLAPEPT